ncbi:MAG: membrane-bound lytic murein transglycosylase F [Marinobacter maritimus]|jgi:membrane-bound lytic murein transglycosylase F
MDLKMPFIKFKQPIAWLSFSFLLLLLTACNPFLQTTHLENIQKRGDIMMGTINGSLTYSFDGSVYSGFDYELGKQLADDLKVKLTIKEYPTFEALFQALDNNKVDFLAAGLTLTPKRAQKYRSSPPYYFASQKLVYRKGSYRPREAADINAPVAVLKDSSHQETLEKLLSTMPELEVNVLENSDQETLLRKVAEKEITFAVVNSSTLAQKQRYYPVLTEAFTISEKQPVAWLLKRHRDDTLYSAIIEFMGNRYDDQSIAKLEEKYFGHVRQFDFVDTKVFLRRNQSILPEFESLFKKHATSTVDWLLLAAVSYQESHWDPKAKSPTGVRGMMMLTLDTADYIGIKNRLDPAQSIKGGADYLTLLIKRLPQSIPEHERIWFALASYNLGYGHVMDARRITLKRKQNPDAWSDVKENLPLLHEKKWYSQSRYGYARGREAQHYVNNIRQYLKTLTWFVAERTKRQTEQKIELAAKAKLAAEQELAAKAKLEAEQKSSPAEKAQQEAEQKIELAETAKQEAEQKVELAEKANQEAEQKSRLATKAKLEAEQKIELAIKAEQEAEQKSRLATQAEQEAEQKNRLATKAKLEAKQKIELAAKVKLEAEQKIELATKAKQEAEQKIELAAEAKLAAEQKIELATKAKLAAEQELATKAKLEAKQTLAAKAKLEAEQTLAANAKLEAEQTLAANAKLEAEKVHQAAQQKEPAEPKKEPELATTEITK